MVMPTRKCQTDPAFMDTGILANPCGVFVAFVPVCFAAKSDWKVTYLGSAHLGFSTVDHQPSLANAEIQCEKTRYSPQGALSWREDPGPILMLSAPLFKQR